MDIQASIEESSIKLSILVPCAGLSVGRWRVHTKAMSPCILCQVGEFRPLGVPEPPSKIRFAFFSKYKPAA
ncbi:hypothetical protein SAMN05720354_1325 [Nitrosospira sp. Nsp1]|nr:hypothetical protein SAMN05720354_1325 [Nitrosospira sp. Nsp1]